MKRTIRPMERPGKSILTANVVAETKAVHPSSSLHTGTSLDPDNWQDFSKVAHAALDDALEFLKGVGERPVWQAVPDHVKRSLETGVPMGAKGISSAYYEFRELIQPFATGNIHPRFFGWVHGSGTAGGIIAEMLAATMNANCGGRDHGAVYVERQVIDWFRSIFDFPKEASGLLVSGTSMATLIALTVARNNCTNADVRRDGIVSGKPLAAYASCEAHNSTTKALEILGLGSKAMRAIDVDGARAMDPDALRHAIRKDRDAGIIPFCVVATVGTVNTGAIDPLPEIVDICERENIWLHVDGAFGAMTRLNADLKPLTHGIERANSLAFDFHKWLHVPYDAGCILVRDGAMHKETFSSRPDYLASTSRGVAAGDPWFCEYGPELSRGFRALKVWFTLKEHGVVKLGDQIGKNVKQAHHLATLVEDHPRLELLAPVALNIVCFRYVSDDPGDRELDELNGAIVAQLQERGIAVPSTTRLEGRLAIRVNITNHRTQFSDLDILVDAIVELAADLEHTKCEHTKCDHTKCDHTRCDLDGNNHANPEQAQPNVTHCDLIERAPDLSAARLAKTLQRPELKIVASGLATGIEITVDRDLKTLFYVDAHGPITFSPACFKSPASAAVIVRQALELAIWRRHLGPRYDTPAWLAAIGLLSFRVAGLYLTTLGAEQAVTCRAELPETFGHLYAALATPAKQPGSWAELSAILGAHGDLLPELMKMQGCDLHDIVAITTSTELKSDTYNIFMLLRDAAQPVETLLASGGDTRITIEHDSGRNAYGSSTRPLPAEISFSSSTASSISDDQYRDVELLRRDLIANAIAQTRQDWFENRMEHLRADILAHCGVSSQTGIEAIVSASGTDAELIALQFATALTPKRLTNIVIAPSETGSGVAIAATGRHFNGETSQGATVAKGMPIAGCADNDITIETIAIRNQDASARRLDDIDAEIEQLVGAAIASGSRCLLHVLDAAKTGLGAPSLKLVDRLVLRHGDQLDILVDACQMRLGQDSISAYLAKGYMVEITGSKFFTAPAFCGALLVPSSIARRLQTPRASGISNKPPTAPALPPGMKAYSARADWPASFEHLRNGLGTFENLGLLARWTAGLTQMRAFNAIPRQAATETLQRFADKTCAMIRDANGLDLIPPATFSREHLVSKDDWRAVPTIFAFTLRRPISPHTPRQGPLLGVDDVKLIHKLLNAKLADRLADAIRDGLSDQQRQLADQPCMIGQPVTVGTTDGRPIAALRICSSARIVNFVHSGADDGCSEGQRFARVMGEVRQCLDKLDMILRHLDHLRDS